MDEIKTSVLLLTIFVPSIAAAAEGTVSISSLLKEMVDRDAIARFPDPAYVCKQFSSYDRSSTDPEDPSTWFANADRSHFVAIEEKPERTEYVMMDVEGPGAVVRIWATWHGPGGGEFSDGTVRVYLDGEEEPAIEGPFTEFIDGGMLADAPLSQSVSPETPYANRGHNLYLPIPYAEHCKITYSTDVEIDRGAKRGEALYYQINYRTYQSGTEVETFTMERLADAKSRLDTTQQILKEGQRTTDEELEKKTWEGSINSGEEVTSFEAEGPGAVRRLSLRIKAPDLPHALRTTILKIAFDGQQTVWVPVGDFFGTGYKIRPYQSWYTQVTGERVLSCTWVMPYEKSASISIENVGDHPVTVQFCEADFGDWQWDEQSMHFHSTWRLWKDLETRSNPEAGDTGAFDLNYVTIDGKGVYAGDTLTIFNGAPAWWGEGDEKIYIDGESFPSHFGTGTEDYYGYAWCRPETFEAPFHAQPEGEGNLTGGYAVNSRYRLLDAIPFEESLQFDMEMWHWSKTTVDFAPTTFFYARPDADSNVNPLPEKANQPLRLRYEKPPALQVAGAIEGENLEVVNVSGGTIETQNIPQFRWSNDRQLWWINGSPGDELELDFPVDEAGSYRVVANLTKAADYGMVEILVNGKPADQEAYDRFHSTVDHDKIDLGTFDLSEGKNSLVFRIVGTNPQAIKKYMVGLDYLLLEQAE